MADCLVGCVGERQCGQLFAERSMANRSDTMSPYVKVAFANIKSGEFITVGNKSYPVRSHEAVIKSFAYGSSNGKQATIEIIDQEGGAFGKFFKEMMKCVGKASEALKVKVKFGWVGATCNGTPVEPFLSPELKFDLVMIESSMSGGKIKFIANCTDPMQAIFAARQTKSKGGDKKQKLSLKKAIIKLFGDDEPKIKKIEFKKKKLKGGGGGEWDFNKGGRDGPKDCWLSNNQNKLSTAMEWIEPFRTKDNKGIVPTWEATTGTLIFWEDPRIDEKLGDCDAGLTIGTFIVNGGKCSNVLDFSPKINFWVSAANALATGGQTSSTTHNPVKKTIKKGDKLLESPCQNDDVGHMQSVPTTAQAVNIYGTEKATEETSKSQEAHAKAVTVNASVMPIKGELRIVGDPSPELMGHSNWNGRTLSIVFINPFHIFNTSADSCGEWLAKPSCNDTLSRRDYQIRGVTHNISEGSYTTTLDVWTQADNAVDPNQ